MRVLQRATPPVTRASVYNGHSEEPVALTPITERLAVELVMIVLLMEHWPQALRRAIYVELNTTRVLLFTTLL